MKKCVEKSGLGVRASTIRDSIEKDFDEEFEFGFWLSFLRLWTLYNWSNHRVPVNIKNSMIAPIIQRPNTSTWKGSKSVMFDEFHERKAIFQDINIWIANIESSTNDLVLQKAEAFDLTVLKKTPQKE